VTGAAAAAAAAAVVTGLVEQKLCACGSGSSAAGMCSGSCVNVAAAAGIWSSSCVYPRCDGRWQCVTL
jgi:hypothetical protein